MSDVTRFAIIIIGIGSVLWLIQTGWQRSVQWVNQQGSALGLGYRRQRVWATFTKIFGPVGSLFFFLFNPGYDTAAHPNHSHVHGDISAHKFEAETEPINRTATIPPDSDYYLEVVENRKGKGAKIGKRYALVDGIHSIGRKPILEAGVVCIGIENDYAVSRNHLYLEAGTDGSFSVTDRFSAYGTRINGQRLTPDKPYPLKPGDTLQTGNTQFKLVYKNCAQNSADKPGQESFRLRIISGSDKGEILNITGKKLIIGRSKEVDWPLNDAKVSRRHAELRREGNRFVIKDLNSTHGMYVNGLQIETRGLVPGDTINLGDTKIIFETA